MNPTRNAYRIQTITAIIGFFDIFALGFMRSFMALFVADAFGITLVEATFWTGVASLFKQLSYASLSPVWGWLSDRIGCKKMLIRVMAGHSVSHFLLFLSGNVYQFIAFLCLDGILGSMSTPVFTLLSKTTDPEKLPQTISFQQSIQTVGTLLAPGVGATLSYYLGYRPTFLTASLIFAGLIFIVMFLLDEEPTVNPVTAESQVNNRTTSHRKKMTEKIRDYFSFIGFDFICLIIATASTAFINPITPLCLQVLGIADKGELLYFTSLLAMLSSVMFMVTNPIGTKYVKRSLLPILPLVAMVMALAQTPLNNLTLFFIFTMSRRSLQGPIQSNLVGGGGRIRRTGAHMGIILSGRYIGSAVGPFIGSTIATTISPSTTFIAMAVLQLMSAIFLFLRNIKFQRKN